LKNQSRWALKPGMPCMNSPHTNTCGLNLSPSIPVYMHGLARPYG
jgi:hypothetical protein